MADRRKPQDVEKLLERRADDRSAATTEELVFDPRTGQLIVTSRPSPDAVVATQTADDGYFRR